MSKKEGPFCPKNRAFDNRWGRIRLLNRRSICEEVFADAPKDATGFKPNGVYTVWPVSHNPKNMKNRKTALKG